MMTFRMFADKVHSTDIIFGRPFAEAMDLIYKQIVLELETNPTILNSPNKLIVAGKRS